MKIAWLLASVASPLMASPALAQAFVPRQHQWHRFRVADNGGIGSGRSDVKNEDETQSLQPQIGCQAHQEARRGVDQGQAPRLRCALPISTC
jgi:hypothetical protein